MEPTTLHTTKTSAPKPAAEAAGKSVNEPPVEPPAAPPAQPSVELDRRGKQLPARQRVGGIITPQ
jgi:hypothetical protein